MPVFVWEEVFCDWSCGLCVVVARTKKHALEVAKAKFEAEGYSWKYEEIAGKEPKVLETGSMVWSNGGS